MTDNDIAEMISKKLNISLEKSTNTISSILECITEAIISGDEINIRDFGSFQVVKRAARKGFNPYYRKSVDIPSCYEPTFKASKMLKELVKG